VTPFADVLAEHRRAIDALPSLEPQILLAADSLIDCLRAGGAIYWIGNGGSAADCQHLAAELVGRFEGRARSGLRSIALTTDTSVLTSIGNDLGFERIFARQIEAVCRPGDTVVALSTSGRSPNVLAAIETAGSLGARTIGLTGEESGPGGVGGPLANACDVAIVVQGASPARVQEAHILVGHFWCKLIHERLHTD